MQEKYGKLMFRGDEARKFWNRLTAAYFFSLSAAHFEEFWARFLEEQELQVALGAPYIGERELRFLPGTDSISIYLNIGNVGGFVAPQATSHIVCDLAARNYSKLAEQSNGGD